jgi:hypothetical protein
MGGSATGWWSRDTLSRDWLVRIVGADRRLGLRDAVQGALTGTGRGAVGYRPSHSSNLKLTSYSIPVTAISVTAAEER